MIAPDLGTLAIAVVLIATGVLMLASVVRALPAAPAQGDVVPVGKKSKKK